MERKTNAGAICQGHEGSGLVADGGPQVMYRSFDLKRTRTSLIKELYQAVSYLTKLQKHLYVGCAERKEKV